MKDTYYFSHDYNCRSDIKIKKLLIKHGFEGYGVFWAIIEDLYNNANALPIDCEGIAYDLRTPTSLVHSIIHEFDLFDIEDGFFSSRSIKRRLDQRNEKSIKARQSATKRWNKENPDANALRTQCDGIAIKERKVKESKENTTVVVEEEKKELENPPPVEPVSDPAFPPHEGEKGVEYVYTLNYCKVIALKDDSWVQKGKVQEHQLNEFIDYLTLIGESTKSPKDFKKHFTLWAKKRKQQPAEQKEYKRYITEDNKW